MFTIHVLNASLANTSFFLAQRGRMSPQQSAEVFTWLAILIGAALLLGIIAAIIRKLYNRDTSSGGIGYSLSDLRDLHKKGELTDDEFAAAKALIIAQGKAALEDPKDGQKSDNWDNITSKSENDPADIELGEELLDVEEDQEDENSQDSSDKNPSDD